jgi:D-methionine transport system ATP-binding protein
LAISPEILFCDEATSALDPQTTKSILSLIRELQQRLKITVVLITHQMTVIQSICDEVAVLEKGIIAEQGPMVDVFNSPKTEAAREMIYA